MQHSKSKISNIKSSGTSGRKTVLAVSSGGGHWVQLLRLLPVLARFNTFYSTVDEHYRWTVKSERFCSISDTSFSDLKTLLPSVFSIIKLLNQIRPDIIISTGAAPGAIAIAIGKLMGSTTVWIDSIANTRRLSTSGTLVRSFADLHFCQWPTTAANSKSTYIGDLL